MASGKASSVFLFLFLSLISYGLVPRLPEGAVVEWGGDKAWRSSSSHRESICVNGLWQFRSEARGLEQSDAKVLWQESDDDAAKHWRRTNRVPGAKKMALNGRDTTRFSKGKSSVRIDLDTPSGANLYHFVRIIEGLPTGRQMIFYADVWNELEANRIVLEIQDERDYTHYMTRSINIPRAKRWQRIAVDLNIPRGTKAIKVIAARNYGDPKGVKGSLWIDNMRIVDIAADLLPAVSVPQDDAWGYALVPGGWNAAYFHEKDSFVAAKHSIERGWFRRTVDIPASWKGRRVVAYFERLTTDGIVFANGVEMGRLGHVGGGIDVTSQVVPGQKLELAILVQARSAWRTIPGVMVRDFRTVGDGLSLRGLNGDVFVYSEPKNVRLGDARIVTDVSKRQMTVTAPLVVPQGAVAPSDLKVRCVVKSLDGAVQSVFEAPVKPGAAQVSVSETWKKDVRLWDYKQPHLYTMNLQLVSGGKVLDETLPERFGYREFKIAGKYFYLNGVKMNLKPCAYWAVKGNWNTVEAMRHWIRGAMKAGYNFVYLDKVDRLGLFPVAKHFLTVCDEEGMLAATCVPADINGNNYRRILNDSVAWEGWTTFVRACVTRVANHPSLVMWRMNMNAGTYAQDQNPLVLDGRKEFKEDSRSAVVASALLKSNAFVRSLDDTRPIYNHACGKTGEIYTTNNYLGWPEPQDLREWLRVWSERGTKPLMMVEQATPYPGDFQMLDPKNWWRNEPLLPEYGAIYLDEAAYELVEDEYVDHMAAMWRPKQRDWIQHYHYYCNNYPQIIDICSSRAYEIMMPAWRTWGISGNVNAWENAWMRLKKRKGNTPVGREPEPQKLAFDWEGIQRPGYKAFTWMYPFGGGGEIRALFLRGEAWESEYYEPTLRSKVMPQVIAPRYAYIGGPGNRWYTQEHGYKAGEKVEKSLIFINDLRHAETFSYVWRCMVDGKEIASGKGTLEVQPAEVGSRTISFRAPFVRGRTDAILSAEVKARDVAVPVKSFALQFYPGSTELPSIDVSGWGIVDKSGKTTSALKANGIEPRAIALDGTLPHDLKVLVIGCNTLGVKTDGTADIPAVLKGLDARVAQGLRVIFFEQTGAALQATYGLRWFTPGARKARIRVPGHGLVAGLSNEELADWRGKTTLGPLDGVPEDLDESQRWKRVWRCSQEGVVASTLVEKPHQTSCLPILDGGFDLRYMSMWETRSGLGKMLFCQLDVTDRLMTGDVIARKVLGNMLSWSKAASTEVRRTVVASAAAPGAGKVLVVRKGGLGDVSALGSFLTSGGVVVASGLSEAEGKALASVSQGGFEVASATLWSNRLSRQLPPEFAGVSPAGIMWRLRLPVSVVSSVGKGGWRSETGVLAVVPVGRGKIVWMSADAGMFDVEARPDLIFSRVNTERVLTQVLHNLGIDSGMDWSGLNGKESELYTDTRVPRDDPYAYMRW